MRLAVQLFAAVLATAVALAGFASMAMAHKTATGSQHTMDFTTDVASDRFAGQVSSAKAFCERGRSVTLYRVVGDASCRTGKWQRRRPTRTACGRRA